MNCETSLHIALAAALILAFGTGCASIGREPQSPNPAPEINVPPKIDAEPTAAAVADEPSAPLPQPAAELSPPKHAVTAPKPALKKVPPSENIGLLSKTPIAQPPSEKPDGSLTRLDEMKKQGTMSEEAYGQIKRQILENPE
jgi:hypothetical protein